MKILKFKPILKKRIWGGQKLASMFGKKIAADEMIGESWELSGLDGDVSVVSKGNLRGNSLNELTEIYMGDLVGESVFEKFGEEFPLLIKLIDAHENLSIQVHPDDKMAAERHHSYGKTEMWYVLDHEPGAELLIGFNQPVDRATFESSLSACTLESLLRRYPARRGDAFFLPPGTIHAIGKGVVLAEIQQPSDITYRVYDYNRLDDQGHARELHTTQAIEAIDFDSTDFEPLTMTSLLPNTAIQVAACEHFNVNSIYITDVVERQYSGIDSFVVYLCLEGELRLESESGTESIIAGETALVPAIIDTVTITGRGHLLETYVVI